MILIENYIELGNLGEAQRIARLLRNDPRSDEMLTDDELSLVDRTIKADKICDIRI
tara:strand:+ start:186 stop:353 length:168 start_codon:yes stop_codon:yes gene_type:complete